MLDNTLDLIIRLELYQFYNLKLKVWMDQMNLKGDALKIVFQSTLRIVIVNTQFT